MDKALSIVAGIAIAMTVVVMCMVLVYVAGKSDKEILCGGRSELYCGPQGCKGDNGLVTQTP